MYESLDFNKIFKCVHFSISHSALNFDFCPTPFFLVGGGGGVFRPFLPLPFLLSSLLSTECEHSCLCKSVVTASSPLGATNQWKP